MPDVFDVLRKDHQDVREMLAKLKQRRRGAADDSQREKRRKRVEKLIIEESKHEAMEEAHFWPAVRETLPNGDKLADHAIGQEQEAKEVLGKLDSLDPKEPDFEKLLGEFITAGREHMEFEETQVWPAMRKALSKRESNELGKRIKNGKKSAPTRPHPHTPPSPTALKTTGPAVAAVDKVRDAVAGRGQRETSRARAGTAKASSTGRKRGATSDMTRDELYEEARALGVKGRSAMNKQELARHVSARRRTS